MDVELQARHVELTDKVRAYVDTKVGRLNRYLPDISSTRVDLQRRQTHSQGEVYTAQVTAWVNGTVLRAEEMNGDLYAAIDLAAEKMHRQIERYKGKRHDRWHERSEPAPLSVPIEDVTEAKGPTISRRKRFPIYAMNEAEALEQFDLLGHDFFIFRNPNTGEMNVLYRRQGGELGLIEPELA
jgi:putative sigma-54 modulation protein